MQKAVVKTSVRSGLMHLRLHAQEYNNPRFRRCGEGWLFGITILLYIDKGVPVLLTGFQ